MDFIDFGFFIISLTSNGQAFHFIVITTTTLSDRHLL